MVTEPKPVRSDLGLIRRRTKGRPRLAARLGGGNGRGRRERAGAGRERAQLLLQLLHLGAERPDLRLDAVEPPRFGGTEGGCRAGLRTPNGGGRSGRAAGQRFERADHHLHVDELLLELLDALAQASLARRSAALARGHGGFRGRHRRRSSHGPRLPAHGGIGLGLLGASRYGRQQHQGEGAGPQPAVRDQGHGLVLDFVRSVRSSAACAARKVGRPANSATRNRSGQIWRLNLNRDAAARAGRHCRAAGCAARPIRWPLSASR